MLTQFEKFNHRLSSWFEWVGFIGMLLMMTITCIDVIGSKVFRAPLLGALDYVQLCQIVAISFAASMALIAGRHIRVEYFFNLMPRRIQSVINSIILLTVLVFFIIIIWRMIALGQNFQSSGEYSATAYIPFYPFAYGAALAFIPLFLVLLQKFIQSLKKGGRS